MLRALRHRLRAKLYKLHGKFHDTVTINTKQGRLTMSTSDEGIAAPLFRHRQYEFASSVRCIRMLKENGFVKSDNIHMVDIGANIGLISTGLLLAGEIESALAIEPEPANFALLQRNVAQNHLAEQMCCVQVAAGEQTTELTMELSPGNRGDHRIRQSPVAEASECLNESARESIAIPAMPLGEILKLPDVVAISGFEPSMLWVDVQGYEGFVFNGAEDVLVDGMPTVTEIWPYGILRSGMNLAQFTEIVQRFWTHYWIYRRQRFIRYPISVFDCFLAELGSEGAHENIILTKTLRRTND